MSRNRRSRDRGYISGNRIIAAPTYDEALVNYLVVAGGGGGGQGFTGGSGSTGGGGAGGLRSTVTNTGGLGALESPLTLISSNSYVVTIGAGGTIGLPGSNSVFATVTSTGGGSGAYSSTRVSYVGGDGGSSGGGANDTNPAGIRTASPIQGFNGAASTSQTVAGGGGGAGGAASGATRGAGLAVSITGSSVTYALGGEAGGGAGTKEIGATNSGTGGGGNFGTGSAAQNGYSGGSGVVILRYSNLYTLNIGAGLSYSTQVLNDDKLTTFTGGSGTISLALAPVTTGDYESIATVLVGSAGASTVTFSNIPQTYKHLQIRMISKESGTGTGGPNVVASLNSDTTYTNYRSHYLNGDGSAVGVGGVQAGGYFCLVGNIATSNASYTNMFGVMVVDILDYTNTSKYRTLRCLWGHDRNGTGEVGLDSSLWMNTAAITSISFNIVGGTNFVQYSSFALYGIRG